MSEPWRPLYARENEREAQAYDALHEGVPTWLVPSLWEWILEQVITRYGVDERRLRDMELMLRRPLWNGPSGGQGLENLQRLLVRDSDLMLSVTDYLASVYKPPARVSRSAGLGHLDHIFRAAGSAWRVQREGFPPGLVRRVDTTVEEAARDTLLRSETAGGLLARAWKAIYGLSPNPSEGYRLAVRAVEAAAIPVALPNDRDATLGRVIGTIKGQRHLWHVSLTHRDDPQQPVAALLAMMESLWRSQHDRHVNLDPAAPLHVSQEEAETALHLAVTLVQWFTSGRVTRPP
jgi:hypothetical protein